MYKIVSSAILIMLCVLYCALCWKEGAMIEVSNQFLGIVAFLATGNAGVNAADIVRGKLNKPKDPVTTP